MRDFIGRRLFVFVVLLGVMGLAFGAVQPSMAFTEIGGFDFTGFTGSGFAPAPVAGQLDSDDWATTGWSDGSMAFGGTETSGDFARGSSSGGVGTGGIYAFDVGAGNIALGVQPGGSDFTPGTFTLRIQNNSGKTMNRADLSYNVYFNNDQPRANSLNFSYSDDDVTYTPVGALDVTSPEASDALGWQTVAQSTSVTGINVPDGGFFYLRWTGDDVSGGGSRDEFAIDDISLIDPSYIIDQTAGTANNDGMVNPGEYTGLSRGINSGLGDVVGATSELHIDADSGGALNLGLVTGPGAFNDRAVIYIDSVAGGFADTTGLTDVGDPLRRAISGCNASAVCADLFFPASFAPDYAIALDSGSAGLWQLVGGGSHTFITSANLMIGSEIEMDLTLADIGLTPGGSFTYVLTYLNPEDVGTAFRSDEFHGVSPLTVPAGNPGGASVTLVEGDCQQFVTPAPTSIQLVSSDITPSHTGGYVLVLLAITLFIITGWVVLRQRTT